MLFKLFRILWVVPESCYDLMALCHGIHVSKRGQVLWTVAVLAIFWALWLERNNRIFEGGGNGLDSVWESFKFWVATWLHNVKDFKNFSFLTLLSE